jgi:small subunit ribosomal protein S13
MARISGIDLPKDKRGEVGLTYIYGIGRSTAKDILAQANVDFNIKVKDWNDDQINEIRRLITENIKT